MPKRLTPSVVSVLIVVLTAALAYGTTMARGVVWGDPTEYTFVAHVLGIAHPPGYAFFTLLGHLFQTLVPFGEVSWRMHLLSAVSATLAALFALGTVQAAGRHVLTSRAQYAGLPAWLDLPVLGGLFAALSVLFAATIWQHSIHANPHIVTATFLAANLFLLTRWGVDESRPVPPLHTDRWLYAFALSTGLGVTHHPLTVFAFPAYALFVLLVRPSIWREWRTVLAMLGFALLGLAVWLYFPIRSSAGPPFGPDTMITLNGFLDHILARGLSESLPFYSLADFPNRTVVFWTLLRLQYTLPVVALAAGGLGWLMWGRQPESATSRLNPRLLALLYGLAFLGNYLFTINLRAQDIMAYLLGPFIIVAVLAGFGALGALSLARQRARARPAWLVLLAAALFFTGPAWQLVSNQPRIALRDYNAAGRYVDEVFTRFDGSGEGAVLLNDWEHMTPLWYAQFVEERWPSPNDVEPVLVSTAQPWLESVFAYLPGGPVYLSNYRREIVAAGFRLRPDGPLYRVVEPGETSVPDSMMPLESDPETVGIVAYELPRRNVTAGDFVPLALAMQTPTATEAYVVPVVTVGDMAFPFTTDSHLVSPLWEPGEVIIERFDFSLPHDLAAGIYPVSVGLFSLTDNEPLGESYSLGEIGVAARETNMATRALAAFRQRVELAGASARLGAQRVTDFWQEPLRASPGDVINLTLEWRSRDHAEQSYTVFVHLIDAANRPLVELDYTPLGGSAPTHLWIPKWLPGQRMLDPYRLVVPDGLSPGTYYIEVGLYEMVSGRRLHMADEVGNLIGDRAILGPVEVVVP